MHAVFHSSAGNVSVEMLYSTFCSFFLLLKNRKVIAPLCPDRVAIKGGASFSHSKDVFL